MSRTQRNALIAAFFFILTPLLIVLDHRFGGQLRQTIEQSTYSDPDFRTYHRKTFTVLEVIDGDTLDIDIPDGERFDTRIRLVGVDTPETKHPTVGLMYYGPEATDFATQLALDKQVTIVLDTVSDIRDRYGRLLAYVVLPDGRVLNAELIKNGYGYAYLGFPHSEFANYQTLMEQAIQEKKGLWQHAVRDDLPKWLRSKRPELLRHSQ
ncbi:MAG: thermonuclease family protein [Planctomycetota bacterium]